MATYFTSGSTFVVDVVGGSGTMPTGMYGIGILSPSLSDFVGMINGFNIVLQTTSPIFIGPGEVYSGFARVTRFSN